jgi:hypothetical protein
MSFIAVRLISDDKSPLSDTYRDFSVFMSYALRFEADVIMAPMGEGEKKDPELEIWKGVSPENGKYSFEIATELPYFIPDMPEGAEFVLNIEGDDIFFCNRMVKAFSRVDGHDEGNLGYYLAHRSFIEKIDPIQEYPIYPLPLKTFASKKFEVEAASAEEAISNELWKQMDSFVVQISSVIDYVRSVDKDGAKRYMPHAAMASYPIFWLVCSGAGESRGCIQFAGDMGRAAFRPVGSIDSKSFTALNNLITKDSLIPGHVSALNLAETFLHYGFLDLSVVQICIACEIALAGLLKDHLINRGVSKTQIEKYFDDVTFSSLLNMYLPIIVDLTNLDNYRDIVGKINWARQRRNKIVHMGFSEHDIKIETVNRAISSARDLIEYIL